MNHRRRRQELLLTSMNHHRYSQEPQPKCPATPQECISEYSVIAQQVIWLKQPYTLELVRPAITTVRTRLWRALIHAENHCEDTMAKGGLKSIPQRGSGGEDRSGSDTAGTKRRRYSNPMGLSRRAERSRVSIVETPRTVAFWTAGVLLFVLDDGCRPGALSPGHLSACVILLPRPSLVARQGMIRGSRFAPLRHTQPVPRLWRVCGSRGKAGRVEARERLWKPMVGIAEGVSTYYAMLHMQYSI